MNTNLLTWLLGWGLDAGETVAFVGEAAPLVGTELGVLFTVASLSASVSLVEFLHENLH